MSSWGVVAVVGLMALGIASAACAAAESEPASGRGRVEPRDIVLNDEVSLALTMERLAVRDSARKSLDGFRPGDLVLVCFTASEDGFVTVWHQSLEAQETLIYPNARSHPDNERAEPVVAGREYCIGDGSENFGLQVEASQKPQQVYVHWTRTLDQAVKRDARMSLKTDSVSRSSDEATKVLKFEAHSP